MGIFDKAKDFAQNNPDKADQAVDRAGDIVDQRTGGQHAAHVDKAQDMLKGQYGGGQAAPGEAPAGQAPAGEAPAGEAPAGGAPEAPAGEPAPEGGEQQQF
ncbi:antitoxin [Naumannella sp. ID2617S]|nr:antitoxin [Naumannella sp. ID2617S]